MAKLRTSRFTLKAKDCDADDIEAHVRDLCANNWQFVVFLLKEKWKLQVDSGKLDSAEADRTKEQLYEEHCRSVVKVLNWAQLNANEQALNEALYSRKRGRTQMENWKEILPRASALRAIKKLKRRHVLDDYDLSPLKVVESIPDSDIQSDNERTSPSPSIPESDIETDAEQKSLSPLSYTQSTWRSNPITWNEMTRHIAKENDVRRPPDDTDKEVISKCVSQLPDEDRSTILSWIMPNITGEGDVEIYIYALSDMIIWSIYDLVVAKIPELVASIEQEIGQVSHITHMGNDKSENFNTRTNINDAKGRADTEAKADKISTNGLHDNASSYYARLNKYKWPSVARDEHRRRLEQFKLDYDSEEFEISHDDYDRFDENNDEVIPVIRGVPLAMYSDDNDTEIHISSNTDELDLEMVERMKNSDRIASMDYTPSSTLKESDLEQSDYEKSGYEESGCEESDQN